jgi:hypothetical protein
MRNISWADLAGKITIFHRFRFDGDVAAGLCMGSERGDLWEK